VFEKEHILNGNMAKMNFHSVTKGQLSLRNGQDKPEIWVADSGATKTDWRIIHEDGSIEQAKTIGFNPYHQSEENFEQEVRNILGSFKDHIKTVFFYGAGCQSEQKKKVVHKVLVHIFPHSKIHVEHDLLAAARALCGHEKGIACILGTGSNSALYDGNEIIKNVESLGYILADEGSGTHLGKTLLKHYLRDEIPLEIAERFHKRFDLDKDGVLAQLNLPSEAASFLAQFSRFIFQNLSNPFLRSLAYQCFQEFFVSNIEKYPGYAEMKVHFSGSVAFYFNQVIRQVTADRNIVIGNIIESPIAGLTLYHLNESHF